MKKKEDIKEEEDKKKEEITIEPIPVILNSNNEILNKVYNKIASQIPKNYSIDDNDVRLLLSIDYTKYMYSLLESNNNVLILITLLIIKRLHISFSCIFKLIFSNIK